MQFTELSGATGTVTLDSSTHFFGVARSGVVTATARALHIGRTTMVLEVDLVNDAGKLSATAAA